MDLHFHRPSSVLSRSPDGTLPCPTFAVGNLILPVTGQYAFHYASTNFSFIDSSARSPQNHQSQPLNAALIKGLQLMPIRYVTGYSPHPFRHLNLLYIIQPLIASPFRLGGGFNCSTCPGMEIEIENPVESRVDAPSPAFRTGGRSSRMQCVRVSSRYEIVHIMFSNTLVTI